MKKKGIILFNGEQFNGGYFWTGPTRHSITVLASTCKRDGCFCHRFARISLYMSSVVFFLFAYFCCEWNLENCKYRI